jgi:hypothetical protein
MTSLWHEFKTHHTSGSLFLFQNVGEVVKLLGNHHKVVVQLPMKYRTVDLAFVRAAERSSARRRLAVGPELKNALA